LEQPTPLAPRSAQEALLSLHLLRAALTDPEQPRTNDDDSSPMRVVRPDGTVNAMAALARAVTLASAFRDDETVSAAALALMLTTPRHHSYPTRYWRKCVACRRISSPGSPNRGICSACLSVRISRSCVITYELPSSRVQLCDLSP
jgi:hypothetical protein